jgi:hypothetical protein
VVIVLVPSRTIRREGAPHGRLPGHHPVFDWLIRHLGLNTVCHHGTIKTTWRRTSRIQGLHRIPGHSGWRFFVDAGALWGPSTGTGGHTTEVIRRGRTWRDSGRSKGGGRCIVV